MSLAPIILVLCVILLWVVIYYLEYGKETFVDTFYKKEITNKIIASTIIILFTILPKILDLTLKAYKCINLGDDDNPILYLKADYDIKCWESTHWLENIFIYYFIIYFKVIYPFCCFTKSTSLGGDLSNVTFPLPK